MTAPNANRKVKVASGYPPVPSTAVIAGLTVPVFVVTGDDDRVVPTADSIRLAEDTAASLEVFEACGHIAQEECPGQFLAMMARFRSNLTTPAGAD